MRSKAIVCQELRVALEMWTRLVNSSTDLFEIEAARKVIERLCDELDALDRLGGDSNVD